MKIIHSLKWLGISLFAMILVACGGGGGSAGSCAGAAYIPTVSYGILTGSVGLPMQLGPTTNVPSICADSVNFTLASGSLPAGLTLNASNGIISGTPTTVANTAFTVRMTVANYADVTSATITSSISVYVVPTSKQWTLMVYIAGDNNLSEFALADLQELKNASTNANVNVVVQFEYNGTYASSSTYSGGNTYRGAVVGLNSPMTNIGVVNMSDKASLTQFINWSKTNYPANQYGLVLWSHGGGWKANKSYRGAYNSARGALADDSAGGFMSMKDIKDGIATAMGPIKLDILAFDACLMGHYEVAYELKDRAKYLVASEELVPGPGMPYTQVVNALTANPAQTPLAYATAMAQAFNAYYATGTDDTTVSVTDLSVMNALHSAVLDLSTALVNTPASGEVTSAKAAANSYGGTGPALFAIDLYKFADYLASNASNPATQTAALAVKTAVTSAVGSRSYTTGSAMSGSKGIAIYMPPAQAAELSSYQAASSSNDAVSGKSTWKDFLSNFYGSSAGSAIKVAGDFAYYITWDNANADVDLVINEPLGNWAAPWLGSTSPNGFLSADSYYSGQNFESYTAAPMVDGGNSYDVFVQLAGCKSGNSCAANVKLYKKDGLNAAFNQVWSNAADGSYYVCINCTSPSYQYNTIGSYPYTTTNDWSTLINTVNASSDWYYLSNTQRSSFAQKSRVSQLKNLKFKQQIGK